MNRSRRRLMNHAFNNVLATALLAGLIGCSQEEPAKSDMPETAITEPAPAATIEMPDPVAETSQAPAIQRFFADLPDVDKSNASWKEQLQKPATLSFDPGKTIYWQMQTNKGPMRFRLFHDTAPEHTTSTMYLTEIGFYDDVVFHRVIPGFMAQGGDPTGTGRGGPGYMYNGEFGGTDKHNRPGLLSMANAGPGTDGSQFFITFVATPWLDGKHTIFGELVSGMETVSAFEALGSRSGRTSETLVLEKAIIVAE